MKYCPSFTFILVFVILSCANVTTPEGGPKDTEPPVLVRSDPEKNQTNFSGRNVEITFSESIQANNPKEEIIIIPPLGKKTEYKVKNNRFIIEPENPWKENTTYTISFREAIKDITEGNTVPDLQLAFSTGKDIDSLTISGSVKESLRETIPDKITIAIYQADTFKIFEHTPEYFTKSSKTGQFRITNLKPGTYRLYAFDDKNKNLKAESRTERFGFLSTPIKLDTVVSNLQVSLVSVDSRPLKIGSVRNQSTLNTIRFNKQVQHYQIKSTPRITHSFGTNQSEIFAHYPGIPEDSLAIQLTAQDSLLQQVDTIVYIKRDDNEKIEESFRVTSKDPLLNLDTDDFEFTYSFNKPILQINHDSLYIELDSIHSIPIRNDHLRMDTINNRIRITEKIIIPDSHFTPTPKLRMGKAYLMSIDQDTSRAESKSIKLINAETTGILLVEVQTHEKNYIVQLLNAANEVLRESKNEKKISFKYLNPESFKIRLIIDSNANGKWDTANYLQNQEPEKTLYYQNQEKKFEVPLRANWEVGPLILKF